MTEFKPPKRAPGDRSHLQRLVGALSERDGVAEERLRRWLSTMVLLGALARDGGDDEDRFVLKGGVALELRFRLRARATGDVDVIVLSHSDDLVDSVERALTAPYLDFAFRITNLRASTNTPAQRMDVKLAYKGKPWATIQLEGSPPEAGTAEIERISAVSLTELGLVGPETVACQSVRCQIATKLHAVTERFEDRENDRFRDLIDIVLLYDLAPGLARLREACVDVFSARGKHAWPPALTVEPSWPAGYQAFAAQLGFEPTDVREAVAAVVGMIAAIDQATG